MPNKVNRLSHKSRQTQWNQIRRVIVQIIPNRDACTLSLIRIQPKSFEYCDAITLNIKHIFRHRFAIPWRYLHQWAIDFAKARVHSLRSKRAAPRHKYYMQAKSIQLQRSKAVAHMPFNRFQHKWRSFSMTNGQKYIQLMFAMRERKRTCTHKNNPQ